ncbi:MAG TPA: YciI family protein [Pseudolabrys sp.]|nr:YciI family protein [Pseudolabrys sp.]
MPLYIVHCLDAKDALAKRKQFMAEHSAYMATASSKRIATIMQGPLVHESNDSAGSCYLMEAPDIATVKAFNAADPFVRNGVFETVNIHQYLRRAP